MHITILGHGNVGGTLARVWANAGHAITIGARRPSDGGAQHLARNDRISVTSIPESIPDAEVILLAVPAGAGVSVADQIATAGPREDVVFLDATNAVGGRPDPYATVADALLDRIPGSRVVKAFNTTGAANMADPRYGDTALDMFVAGDDAEAKEIAASLATDAGFARCYDVGDRRFFESLEHLAQVWISLALSKGHGRDIGFKVLRRGESA
jgi:hypothetical protein